MANFVAEIRSLPFFFDTTTEEANYLLQSSVDGTYLVRPSTTAPGHFVLLVVEHSELTKLLIGVNEAGITLGDQVATNVAEIIASLGHRCRIPYRPAPLHFEAPWWQPQRAADDVPAAISSLPFLCTLSGVVLNLWTKNPIQLRRQFLLGAQGLLRHSATHHTT